MLLDLFYHLSDEDPQLRGTAANKLIVTLSNLPERSVGLAGHEDLEYCLKRLFKGLQSSREKARQGFGMALTELLNVLHKRNHKIKLQDLLQLLEFKSCKGHEYRDLVMGKIFGYACICQSAILTETGSISASKESLFFMVDQLLIIYEKKTYLKPIIWQIVYQLTAINTDAAQYTSSKIVSMDNLLIVAVAKDFDFENVVKYLHGTTGLAPILHPVYFNILEQCPKDKQMAVWNDVVKFLSGDNRKRFLLLKLYNKVIEEYRSSFEPIVTDDRIYNLISKSISSRSKSLKNICHVVLPNISNLSKNVSEISLILSNYSNLKEHAQMDNLSLELMEKFLNDDSKDKLLLFKHLIRSKKVDLVKKYFQFVSEEESMSILKFTIEIPIESVKLDLILFILKSLDFKHSKLLEKCLEKNRMAAASCLIAYFLVEKNNFVPVDEDMEQDILNACENKFLKDGNAYDVLADIYVNFLTISSSVIRHIISMGSKDLSMGISKAGLQVILDVLLNQEVEFEDASDEDMSDAMTISTDDESDESSEVSESDMSDVEYSSEGQDLEAALNTAVKEIGSEEDDASSVNSEYMFKIDAHFEKMFKLKKQENIKKLDASHFQSKVLDIIEQFLHVRNEPAMTYIAFYSIFQYRKRLTSESVLSTKCDKMAQYLNQSDRDYQNLNLTKLQIDDVKKILEEINLNGAFKVYYSVVIKMTYHLKDCKEIIFEKCSKYMNSQINDLPGYNMVLRDILSSSPDQDRSKLLAQGMLDGSGSILLFKELFSTNEKMQKLRNRLKPLLQLWRNLKKNEQIADVQNKLIEIINEKTQDLKKEKQQVGALKGIVHSIVDATGIKKQDILLFSK
eukprot:NODE_204_length_12954_cov_1.347880.p2 type:complete len:851 gc:universal NODE_204_length_12954_cov_1.347880:3371-5923(+)